MGVCCYAYALSDANIERIKTAHEKLSAATQKAGSMLYSQGETPSAGTGGGAGQGGGATGGPSAPGGNDDVVDAEVVDDDKK